MRRREPRPRLGSGDVRWFFTSGRVVDVALVCLAAEAIAFAISHRIGPRDSDLPALLANSLAGALLLLALRAALTGSWWGWIALALTGALLAHALELQQRLAGKLAVNGGRS